MLERNIPKVRVITKQRAVRFDVEDTEDVFVQAARRDIVGRRWWTRVVSSTTLVRTLGRFLVRVRKLPPSGSRVVALETWQHHVWKGITRLYGKRQAERSCRS